MNESFDKEAWASRKQQDREAAYAMVDDALKKMGPDTKAFQTYLDVQSKFERYSVSNALLVAAQKPEATDLGDANFWRGRGGYIRKGESGILLMEPGNSYTRKDGSKGVNIHIKRVFDISQTTLTPTKQPAVSQDTRLLLNAMVRYAPCKVDFRDELPDGQSALYSPQKKTVFVLRGQSMEDVFRGVAQELAHAYLDTGNYNREENVFLAQCVGNMLCQRNGIDGNSLAVSQLPQKYAEMEPKQLREYLKSIRTAANQISADMFRFRLSGRSCHCAGLCNFLCLCVLAPCSGCGCSSGQHGMELYRRTDLQYADPRRVCEDGRPGRAGDDGTIIRSKTVILLIVFDSQVPNY